MADENSDAYQAAGVDVAQAENALTRITKRLRTTWPESGPGRVALDFGKYANIVELAGGQGLAICADGVGTKALIAQMLGKYDTIGIDCVAMNVNDLVCVGAKPLSLVDYIAVERTDPTVLDQISIGLTDGAVQSGASIPGGEIAEMPGVITGWKPGLGFDLAAMATGTVALDAVNVGADVAPGDVVVGIGSNGIHSNGMTLARKVFFDDLGMTADSQIADFGRSVGEELLEPTFIYVGESVDVLDQNLVTGLIHITGEGFLNLTRVEAPVGFVLDTLPDVPAVFRVMADQGGVPRSDLYGIYNMGVGMGLITRPENADAVVALAKSRGKPAQVIGTVTAEPGTVRITSNAFTPVDLVNDGKTFRPA
ncbi:MAG: phosphoribosylformylglycinamidine cyclo-ligase [Alphaproteobacteria bacterium]|jgi:phosphoribosylformylglycinamidine cyclo-ligase|nr:phosphoribosylformylglycinamidine cyclo-ligase [Alphaproteobacteria bacterium]MBT4710425.1 phosphoribosylformylglycinamidine cyclo-ligase [Alphaproteobacteria bacterium]MBT5859871.1 phosphoribosylformylglycinamidine cyclo-ligase [Alphaproteobacteria bacterium]